MNCTPLLKRKADMLASTVLTIPNPELDLVLTRTLNVSPAKAYRCWTEPALITQWFTPPPWTTPHAVMDVRVGGMSHITMRGPANADGTLAPDVPNAAIYLTVIPNERLISTNAFGASFTPVPIKNALMAFHFVIDLHFGVVAGDAKQTAYTATCRHWTVESKTAHEAMGFHVGWGIATDQLEALAKTL
jgi:uncharacterized protein YndB with AHSA1/START domain